MHHISSFYDMIESFLTFKLCQSTGQIIYLSNECKKIGNLYQSLGVAEPIRLLTMTGVTDLRDQKSLSKEILLI